MRETTQVARMSQAGVTPFASRYGSIQSHSKRRQEDKTKQDKQHEKVVIFLVPFS